MNKEQIKISYAVEKLFSIPIHYIKIDDFEEKKQDLINYAKNMRDFGDYGRKASNRGGWQSSSFILNDEGDLVHDLLMKCLLSFPTLKKSVNFGIFSPVIGF